MLSLGILNLQALRVVLERGSDIILDCIHRVDIVKAEFLPSVFPSYLGLANGQRVTLRKSCRK